ncbi:MAG: ATP-binding cassette domain-containing protein [Bryobacteraceae bacterium]
MIVSVENLAHSYGSRLALAGVSFQVEQGEIFGLLGPNGGGKSTLFRILATMMTPRKGRATVAGHDVERSPAVVRRQIGVVFQSHSLDRSLTVAENLRSQGYLHGLSGAKLAERMETVMSRLGIADRRNDLVEKLSGGLKRRVEIAKGLLHKPGVLLMDEASTGLDPRARRELWSFIEDLRAKEGVTVLLTTHILEEADRCDRLILLHQGSVVAEGKPSELKDRIGGDVVVLAANDAEGLAARVRSRFSLDPRIVDGTVRVEIANGHRFITEVVEAFPGSVDSVALHKPTLEDLFVRETGALIC